MDVIDTSLRGNPMRWSETHKDGFLDWDTTQINLMIIFKQSMHANMEKEVYMRETNPYQYI